MDDDEDVFDDDDRAYPPIDVDEFGYAIEDPRTIAIRAMFPRLSSVLKSIKKEPRQ